MSKLLKLFPFERADFVGGITTFLTVSYILAVNPAILSTPLLFIVARAEAALGWAIKMDMIMSAVSVTLIVAGSWVFMAMQQQQNKHKKVANKIE
jgi:xanthine/uracil/vitamin C permease (AzgA family)